MLTVSLVDDLRQASCRFGDTDGRCGAHVLNVQLKTQTYKYRCGPTLGADHLPSRLVGGGARQIPHPRVQAITRSGVRQTLDFKRPPLANRLSLSISDEHLQAMRSPAPALMPIFRSQHQAELLAWLLLHPAQEYTLSDLAARLDVPLPTLHRESRRLVAAGLLLDRVVGRARLLRADPGNPATEPLTRLLELTFRAASGHRGRVRPARRPASAHIRLLGRPLQRQRRCAPARRRCSRRRRGRPFGPLQSRRSCAGSPRDPGEPCYADRRAVVG